ncbi:hypothetical protein ABEB36_005925 [Hypothenemus hampei]|uniref:C2H2-type domain-containing protein n=1 Tax=Hypothenemus hampei TaxID=57062 RepID=A0ABD1F3Q4_HYPHA
MSQIPASFTCISCRVSFQDSKLQKFHYQSDWHRYNLKRKVAELPPVTSEEFQRRVLNQRNVDDLSKQNSQVYCKVCRKSFGNSKAFDNHVNSKKHKEKEKTFTGDEIKTASVPSQKSTEIQDDNISFVNSEEDSDEWDDEDDNPIDNNDCLFCSNHSRSFLENLEHMTIKHSFFISDIEFCTDVEGLLRYLGEKIFKGYMCLWCNEKGKTFYSADAAKAHMVDKGHCKMIYEGLALAEYSMFYDYSSSYPDANKDDTNPDEEVTVPELDGSDYKLVLPSGVTIGHRSLMRYYKQSLNPNRTVSIVKKGDRKLHSVLASYRALGWSASDQDAAARRARDIHYLKRMHSKYMTKLGVKNNKLQKHFRAQVNF